MDHQHILLLGATGLSGVCFIDAVLEMPRPPKLTVYYRPGSRSKLPSAALDKPGIRLVEGELRDGDAVTRALKGCASSSPAFPPVTSVVSALGAYLSLKFFLTRDQSSPLADAIRKVVLPAMKACGVSHILVLSTPTAFLWPAENNTISWKWWLYRFPPWLLVPQGNAEMKGLAQAVMGQDTWLQWTVYRVPHLTNGDPKVGVIAGNLERDYAGGFSLNREGLVRWLLREVEEKKWIRQAPMLGNA